MRGGERAGMGVGGSLSDSDMTIMNEPCALDQLGIVAGFVGVGTSAMAVRSAKDVRPQGVMATCRTPWCEWSATTFFLCGI